MLFPTLVVAAVLHCAGTYDPRCPLFGDVDGDGRADAVFVERRGPCRFEVVVQAKARTLRAPVLTPCGKPAEVWPSGFPRVVALRPMTAPRGFEPEVLLWTGASNQGIRFFTVVRGRLRPLGHEWNVGGFAEAYSLTDCVAPHLVRRASRWFDVRRWHGTTQTYHVTPTGFVRTGTLRVFVPMHDDAFHHCGGVERAPRYP